MAIPTAPQGQSTPPPPSQPLSPTPGPKRRSKVGVVFGALVLIAALILGFYLVLLTKYFFEPTRVIDVEAGQSIELEDRDYFVREPAGPEGLDIVITHESGEQVTLWTGLYDQDVYNFSPGEGSVTFDRAARISVARSGTGLGLMMIGLIGWGTEALLLISGSWLLRKR